MIRRRNSVWTMIFLAAIILIAGAGLYTFTMTRNLFMEEQQRLIGRLYEKNSEICEEIVPYMFGENVNRDDVEKGREAMVALGYTEKGAYYLYQNMGWERIYLSSLLFQAVTAAVLFGLLIQLRKKDEKEESTLAQDIRRIRSQGGTLERKRYGFCGEAVIAEISKVLENLQAKEKYLVEKNKRTQIFIENIAHQIKTPLSCVSLSLDLMMEEVEDKQKERIARSFQYLESVEALMKRLLDIGRLEAGKVILHKESICMESLLEECAEALPDGKERILIEAEGRENREVYYGDYEWLKEAFSNILKNCLEHDKSKEKIRVLLSETAEGMKITIRDHGKGISEKDIPYIFDRFYIPEEAKASHTGIGLNLAKLVIEKHFGTMKAVNHEEGGAVFLVVLPAYDLKSKK